MGVADIPYSRRDPIFAEGPSSKISRSNFRGWNNTLMTPPLTALQHSWRFDHLLSMVRRWKRLSARAGWLAGQLTSSIRSRLWSVFITCHVYTEFGELIAVKSGAIIDAVTFQARFLRFWDGTISLPIADGIVQDKYWYAYARGCQPLATPPDNRACVGCNNLRIGLTVVDGRSTAKIGSLENFQLYVQTRGRITRSLDTITCTQKVGVLPTLYKKT